MLYQRVISGLLFLPLFYLVTWKLPPLYFAALVAAAVVVGQYEFYRMAKARGGQPNILLGIAIGIRIGIPVGIAIGIDVCVRIGLITICVLR